MPSRKNQKHRIKARRETALYNLERRLADKKHWLATSKEMTPELKACRAKAEAELETLQQRVK